MKKIFPSCPVAIGFCPLAVWSRSRIGFETSRKEKLIMGKNQISLRSPAGDLSTGNRRLSGSRFYILALILALGLTGFQMTSAKADCLDECLKTYAQCLYNANGDPILEAICDDRYEDCFEDCPLN
jgi:hypothetical protein